MEGYKSKTGNGLLALCMGKNYQDSMVVYREYVQNSCDSVYEAMKQGYYDSEEERCIAINIIPGLNRVCPMDRGTGVAKTDIGPRLVDIGASIKNGIDQIGSHGIGRLVGANWCDKIIFETSVKGENVKSILTFDSVKAHELIKNKTGNCTESLDEVTSCVYEKEDVDEHYFRVTLENAKDSLFDDLKSVTDYLSSMVPVDYSFEFYDLIQPHLNANPDYAERFKKLICCNVTVNEVPVEKPYSREVYSDGSTEPKKITPPSFFTIEDSEYGQLAWGWYAFNEKIEQMNYLPYRGIRLRKHNMAIGDYDYLTKYFPRPVDAPYFIGEIHITHDDINPTATREAIDTSESVAAKIFFHKLQTKVFPNLKKDYENLSRLGSSAFAPLIKSKMEIDLARKIVNVESIPNEKKEAATEKAQEARKHLTSAKEELKKKLQALNNSETTSPEVVKFVTTQWEKKVAATISENNAKTPKELHLDAFKLTTIINDVLNEQPATPQPPQPALGGNQAPPVTPQEPPVEPKETDVYKALGKSEYKLMKQIYQILDAEKNIPPQILAKLKKKLVKKLIGKE